MAEKQLFDSDSETAEKVVVEEERGGRSQPDGREDARQFTDQRRHLANDRTTPAARPARPTSRQNSTPSTGQHSAASRVQPVAGRRRRRQTRRNSMSATEMSGNENNVNLISGNLTVACLAGLTCAPRITQYRLTPAN